MRSILEALTALLIAYGAIGFALLVVSGGRVNILPGPLVEHPTEPVPRGYSSD